MQPSTYVIQRRAKLTQRQFIEEYVRRRVPVILVDAAATTDWPALHKWSAGYLKDVDIHRFPLFEKAQPANVRVEEGDTIYLPGGWWHSTKLSEFSVAVSMNTINAHNWNKFCGYFAMATLRLTSPND